LQTAWTKQESASAWASSRRVCFALFAAGFATQEDPEARSACDPRANPLRIPKRDRLTARRRSVLFYLIDTQRARTT
jgi:hypothetical protein